MDFNAVMMNWMNACAGAGNSSVCTQCSSGTYSSSLGVCIFLALVVQRFSENILVFAGAWRIVFCTACDAGKYSSGVGTDFQDKLLCYNIMLMYSFTGLQEL